MNTVYALLAERADAKDHTEALLMPDYDEKHRDELCGNRAELDAWLAAPVGREAEAEAALMTYLGGR